MKSILFKALLATLLAVVAQQSFAQYYSWGADRASLKWSKMSGDRVQVIYPDTVESVARRTMHYIDAVQNDISFGFEHSALDIPFVIHPDNFSSNGMVMWLPKRVEFLSTPAIDGFAMPWVKQLVAHEYRHAVQYNNLNRSTVKAFSYILGQQGSAISLLLPPLYALEGDAVLYETSSTTFGRGLQPSFSMGYRALGDELMTKNKFLKWRCGSLTQYVPDHYEMGYQMMSYAYDKYNENVLDKVFWYSARNPIFITPYSIALRKYYDTSTKELFYETFASLIDFWEPLSAVDNSAEILSQCEERNFTSYSHPISLPSGELLVLKEDYRDPSRFVIFDPETKGERVVAHTGTISTRPAYAAGRVWWSEYRRSALFAEDINSQLCYMDVASGRPKSLKGFKSALYPTPIGESTEHLAYVEYNTNGLYSVVEILGGEEIRRTAVNYPNEVHSMAWDNQTERLYIIVTGDSGMWIEQQLDGGFEPLTQPSYTTISNLSAHDGVLYFGSIASGKDEVHSLDIASGVERQLSQSTYGSFQPAQGGDHIYMTTYDKFGYHLSEQCAAQSVGEVTYSQVPENVVNPQYNRFDVVNLDTVRFDSVAMAASLEEHKSKKYRKGTHLFNVHSWAPMRFDPISLLSEMDLDIGLGVTVVSQNLLSSCDAFASYGWDKYRGSMLNGGINYNGLGVELSLSSSYGGDQNVYLLGGDKFDLKRYSDVSVSATLPLYFNRGYISHYLSASVGYNYSNGLLPTGLDFSNVTDPETMIEQPTLTYGGVTEGVNKVSATLAYSTYVKSAQRDLTTPLGYTLSASYAGDPTHSDFSQLLSLYGKLYTPGIAKNNSFTLAAAYQNAYGGFKIDGYSLLSYISAALIPHGFTTSDISNNNYFSASAEYKFPVCYPDFAAFNLLYFKRLSLGFGADYAQFVEFGDLKKSIYSYGADLIVDLNAISMTSASTLTVTMSFYKPQDRGLYFQFGLGMPF